MLPQINYVGSCLRTKLFRIDPILYVINFIMTHSSDNMPRNKKDIRQQGR